MRINEKGEFEIFDEHAVEKAESHQKLLESPIESLDFSCDTFNELKRVKIDTLNDLVERFKDKSIFSTCSFGRKQLEEIVEKLCMLGISLEPIDNQTQNPLKIINDCLSKLSPQEKMVIILLYGLDGKNEHSYEEICERFNITVPGIISAIDSHFLDTLRKQDEFINKEFLQALIKNSDLNPYKKIVENLFNQSIDELLLSRYNIILKSDEDIHNEALFDFEEYEHTVTIKKYIGFSDEQIIIPDFYNKKSVTRIDDYAFENCSFIKEVQLGRSVRFIGKSAFSNCKNLMKVTGNCLLLINKYAFDGCEKLEVFSAKRVTCIGPFAFNECICLCKFDVERENIRRICESSFFDCQCLREIPSLKNVAIIEDNAFAYCGYISDVTFSEDLKKIGDNAFYETNISNVIIPKNVEYIGETAFFTLDNSLNVFIHSTETEIKDEAFGHKAKFGENHQEHVVVYCKPNSTAQMYCRKNGITHQKLET